MEKVKRWTSNQKIDFLYSVIILFVLFFGYAMIKPKVMNHWIDLILTLSFMWMGGPLPTFLRRRKQYKEIKILGPILNISVPELREALHLYSNDIVGWDKSQMNLSTKEIYQVEDYLLKAYFLKYQKAFNLKEYVNEQKNDG